MKWIFTASCFSKNVCMFCQFQRHHPVTCWKILCIWWVLWFALEWYENIKQIYSIEHRLYIMKIEYFGISTIEYYWNGIRWRNHLLKRSHQVTPDSKVRVANMGPTWVLAAPGGPHVGPMNLAIRDGTGTRTLSKLLLPWVDDVLADFDTEDEKQLCNKMSWLFQVHGLNNFIIDFRSRRLWLTIMVTM